MGLILGQAVGVAEIETVIIVERLAVIRGDDQQVPNLVRHVDLLPTLLAEVAGVEINVERLAIEGRSLVPLLRRDAEPCSGSWPAR